MNSSEHIGRKMKLPRLQQRPAIVIAAFGSSRRGKKALETFDEKVRGKFPEHQVYWGYTSEIIRKKTGSPSLYETLSRAYAEGHRKAAVLPLQIFPGVEYREIIETAQDFPGLRVIPGETLMHRWQFVKEVLEILAGDFLSETEGLNLLALHGTPMAGDPANSAYLGLANMVADRYANVLAASLEGVPDADAVLEKIDRDGLVKLYKKVRILPMMYLAGLHVEDDLMGEANSWKSRLEEMGFDVECLMVSRQGEQYYKSLAAYGEIQTCFLQRIERALTLLEFY